MPLEVRTGISLPVLADLELPESKLEQSLAGFLSEEEKERAERFAKPLRRRQHVWSRLLLLALAKLCFTGQSARIQEEPPFSPRLFIGDSRYFTSVTHSGTRVACLVSRNPAAIDIERIDTARPLDRYAKTAFNTEIAAEILKEKDFPQAFYEAWGAYECAVKLGMPREFRWETGSPRIKGFEVTAMREEGWMKVTAVIRGEKIYSLRMTGEEIARLLRSGK